MANRGGRSEERLNWVYFTLMLFSVFRLIKTNSPSNPLAQRKGGVGSSQCDPSSVTVHSVTAPRVGNWPPRVHFLSESFFPSSLRVRLDVAF
jgi:hypothetical protein